MYKSEMTRLATFSFIRNLMYGLNIWRHTSVMPNPLLENRIHTLTRYPSKPPNSIKLAYIAFGYYFMILYPIRNSVELRKQ